MIGIFTTCDKRPEFIEWQVRTFAKFLTDSYELNILNNGSSPELAARIASECERLCVKHHRVENPRYDDPNMACAHPLQWCWNTIIPKTDYDYIVIIDSDMFLLQEFSIIDYLKGFDIAAVKQRRGDAKYIWPGLMFINRTTLPDQPSVSFMYGIVAGSRVDPGGYFHHYFLKHPEVKLRNILHTSHIHSKNNNLSVIPRELRDSYDEEFCLELYEHSFLHYGRSSNWDNMDATYHIRKTKFVQSFIDRRLSDAAAIEPYEYVYQYNNWLEVPNPRDGHPLTDRNQRQSWLQRIFRLSH